jgi:uncharacterized protein YcfJ
MKKILLSTFITSALFAGSNSYTEMVPVISSTPIYKTIVTKTPYKECWEEAISIDDSSNGNAIIGGILGGVIGHQFGGGSGKDVATVLGTIGGSIAGSKNDTSGSHVEYKEKCVTKYKRDSFQRLTGYSLTASHNGINITVKSPSIKQTIPVRVTVSW